MRPNSILSAARFSLSCWGSLVDPSNEPNKFTNLLGNPTIVDQIHMLPFTEAWAGEKAGSGGNERLASEIKWFGPLLSFLMV